MRVVDVQDRVVGTDRVLSAKVRLGPNEDDGGSVWIRRPDPGTPRQPVGDALLALHVIPAMALHEDLVIEAPVSGSLLDAVATQLVPTLLDWHPRVPRVEVRCERVEDLPSGGGARRTGCLFSAGVDAWHSLLRREAEISDLVYISGFDIPPDHMDELARAERHVEDIATQHGKPLLRVATNELRGRIHRWKAELAVRGQPWPTFTEDIYLGSFLVAVGLSLRPRVDRLIVPGSWSYQVTQPVSSHPKMEPAWSTPSLCFEIEGHDRTRSDKIRWLIDRAPEVLPSLRVCQDMKDRRQGELNCGRCAKCVRLRLELRAAGVPAGGTPFPEPLDLRRIRHKRYPGSVSLWDQLLARAREAGDEELAHTVEIIADRRFCLARFLRDVRRAVRKRSLREIRWPKARRLNLTDHRPA